MGYNPFIIIEIFLPYKIKQRYFIILRKQKKESYSPYTGTVPDIEIVFLN